MDAAAVVGLGAGELFDTHEALRYDALRVTGGRVVVTTQ